MRSFFVALLIFACTVPVFSQKPVYVFELNKPYKYFVEGKNNVVQEYQGQTSSTNIEINVGLVLNMSSKNADGNYVGNITIENAFIVVETDQGTQNLGNDLAGKIIPVMIKPDGDLDVTDTAVDLGESGGMISGAFSSLLPRLDAENLKLGGTWKRNRSDTTKTERRTMVGAGESVYNVTAEKTVKGFSCLEIHGDGKVDFTGNIAANGQDLHMEGNQSRKSLIHFDPSKSVMVAMELQEAGEQVITSMSNTDMRVNIATSSTTKVELITE